MCLYVLLSVSVCVSVCISVCVSVCLCLGVGSFTIVDGQTVTADDAGNKLVIINTMMMIMIMLLLPHWSPWASSDTVSCTFSYHTWQFIIFTIFTITTCIFSYSLSVSFWTQDLALQQILLFHRPFPFPPDWLHGFSDHLAILLCWRAVRVSVLD